MAAREGMIAMITANSGRSAKAVAPFGGAKARLGTNPICFAIPSNLEGPLFFDMATSAAAAGKINVATARGEQVPAGWLIDADGKPSTDPRVLRQGGALLPVGGAEGYKGYGLATIVEILSGLLTGLGFGVEPTGRHNDGCFIAVFNVAAFRDLDTFKQEVTEFAQYLKATPPAQGFTEVLYPGEIEFRASRTAARTACRWRTPPGRSCRTSRRATASQTSWDCKPWQTWSSATARSSTVPAPIRSRPMWQSMAARSLRVGEVAVRGREEIDARGLLVTPGFIDPHTHYDAQATWSSRITPSSWNGVTTTLFGNCGVGFAPCKPSQRDMLVKLMEGVEDIPEVVLTEGLPWNWQSFPRLPRCAGGAALRHGHRDAGAARSSARVRHGRARRRP